MQFRVWGMVDGEAFDRVFPSVTCWQAWKRLVQRRYEVDVQGMASVEVAA